MDYTYLIESTKKLSTFQQVLRFISPGQLPPNEYFNSLIISLRTLSERVAFLHVYYHLFRHHLITINKVTLSFCSINEQNKQSATLTIEVLVIWALLTKEIFENGLGQRQIFTLLLTLTKLLINETQVANCHCCVFIVIVAVSSSENVDSFIIVFDCLVKLFQAFFRVSQVGETFSNLNTFSFSLSMLLDD